MAEYYSTKTDSKDFLGKIYRKNFCNRAWKLNGNFRVSIQDKFILILNLSDTYLVV